MKLTTPARERARTTKATSAAVDAVAAAKRARLTAIHTRTDADTQNLLTATALGAAASAAVCSCCSANGLRQPQPQQFNGDGARLAGALAARCLFPFLFFDSALLLVRALARSGAGLLLEL